MPFESSILRRSASFPSLCCLSRERRRNKAEQELAPSLLLQVIKSDFILLSGDVVSNLNLEEAVEAHRERRKISKNAIMTLVVKENGLGTRLR